jgi:hypothetical protein
MYQQMAVTENLVQRLSSLRVGESLVYGYISKTGSFQVDFRVLKHAEKLEADGLIMRFHRRISRYGEFELVAVGTTPALNDRLIQIITGFEIKTGLVKTKVRNED